jgi:hypothetical protein
MRMLRGFYSSSVSTLEKELSDTLDPEVIICVFNQSPFGDCQDIGQSNILFTVRSVVDFTLNVPGYAGGSDAVEIVSC